ncbi:hypothetical protein NDI54_21070 [Haloarcula sp. S1AR25-5A]|uniref:Glutamine amidotransferase type-2 domain-containing protein n=1 Tax=Haloarcula terrestris TaxID=2950533 RepID=A0AAE4F2M8_9EURY|nr:hypothetical protein [Haloarcula terrestris]MDS0223824.1 hypothetical protein [Haloarcula terrestris]
MTGICGIFNPEGINTEYHPDNLLLDSQYQSKFEDGMISAHLISYENSHQPAQVGDSDYYIMALGDIYGYRKTNSEYISKQDECENMSDSEFCAILFEKYGLEFYEDLNSEFVIAVYNQKNKELYLVTDRLGSWPIYTYEKEGDILFSTNLQDLARQKQVNTKIIPEYLQFYTSYGYVPGIRTPLKNIDQLPPGSISTLNSESKDSQSYWEPEYTPEDRDPEKTSKILHNLITQILKDRLNSDQDVGMLLSGGSDSRLLLQAMPFSVDCYHMNDWKNQEYKTAKKVSELTNNDFIFLKRKSSYHEDLLERYAALHEFISEFHQAHAGGFDQILREETDVLVTGLYADTFLKGHFLPTRSINTPLGPVDFPLLKNITDIDDFVECESRRSNGFVRSEKTVQEIIKLETKRTPDGIEYFGVEYPSLESLILSKNFYPLTNQPDSLFQQNLHQLQRTHFPMIDNRLVDFALTIPFSELLKNPPVNRALSQNAPDIASFPHPETGVSLKKPFYFHYLSKYIGYLKEKFSESEYPERYYTDSAWRDTSGYIRESNLVEQKLHEHDTLLSESSYLCKEEILGAEEKHSNGEDLSSELYRILSILEMPLLSELNQKPE